MIALERPGIFMARPKQWRVKKFDSSAIAITIEWVVTRELEDGVFVSVPESTVWGDAFVVKRDGSPNVKQVERLAKSLGWDGSLRTVAANQPPNRMAQITVKGEEYNGKIYYKVSWVNPEDYEPEAAGASPDEAAELDKQLGAALRAAAGQPAKQGDAKDYDDIPF